MSDVPAAYRDAPRWPFGDSPELADELLAAGEHVFDRAWRLPLWDEYQTQLESTYADVYNIGGRWGGAITAGCFLARFTEGQRWAHLDIAGVANDVAVINCAGGTVWIAFLAEAQHDTLVTGYEMGICTRELLDAWGLGARGTRSLA